jgi:tRNA threonylcarbamoyl adenosine modification protein YeaZ
MQKGHAEALMPMIETLCDDSGIEMGALDRLAVTHGPGTFTGVRVGLSAMRGLALSLAIPVKTYGTLAVMAQACSDALPLIVAVDAKRDTFFTQGFMADGTAHGDPQALSAAAVSALAVTLAATCETKDAIALCGTGAPLLADALNAAGGRFLAGGGGA